MRDVKAVHAGFAHVGGGRAAEIVRARMERPPPEVAPGEQAVPLVALLLSLLLRLAPVLAFRLGIG
jgi:hypothetical protein